MKAFRFAICLGLLLAGFVAGGAGCASTVLDRLRLRQFAQEYAYTQDVSAARRAARAALQEMGFAAEFGAESDNRFEMVSRALPGGAAESRLQRRAIVSVAWTSEGMSRVQIGFWDESEDPSASESVPAAGRLIKEGALYDGFWQRMDEALPPGSSLLEPATASPARP